MKADPKRDGAGESASADVSSFDFGPIHQRQLYEQVVARIVEAIANGSLKAGDRLPPERELAERMEVGRPSVREALTSLQQTGIVETRRGAGSYVAEAALEKVREVRVGTEGWDISPAALLDAREIIEPEIARLAAGKPGDDSRIRKLMAEMEAVTDLADLDQYRAWREADRNFHLEIAQRSENEVLVRFAEIVSSVMKEGLWEVFRDVAAADPERRKLYVAEHLLIYTAVEEGRGDAAAQYARDHVRQVRSYMGLDPTQLA